VGCLFAVHLLIDQFAHGFLSAYAVVLVGYALCFGRWQENDGHRGGILNFEDEDVECLRWGLETSSHPQIYRDLRMLRMFPLNPADAYAGLI
jgi:hypothetical protein